MKKRMYELAKTRRGLKKEKAHKRSVYGLSGVPGATRTPGLPLRRRSLCPTELREHGLWGVALGECTSSALGVVNTVSRFVTGFHSKYQKTPVFRRLWMYYFTRFHIVSQGKIRILLYLVCKLCAGKGGCTLSDKDS